MDTQREFDGRTLDQAIGNAMETLGVERHQLKYEILSYGSKGLLGFLGAKRARIRVHPAGAKTEDNGIDVRQLVDELVAETGVASASESAPKAQQSLEITAENVDIAVNITSRIVHGIAQGAQVTGGVRKERIVVNVTGEDAGILIGKHGQTLEAIQYLVEKIAHRKLGERLRIQLDVEGYLETRWTNLKQLALSMAAKAKKNGKPTVIGQLNARDRRVVHLALKDDQEIRTQSRGDGYLRKLIIFPKT